MTLSLVRFASLLKKKQRILTLFQNQRGDHHLVGSKSQGNNSCMCKIFVKYFLQALTGQEIHIQEIDDLQSIKGICSISIYKEFSTIQI